MQHVMVYRILCDALRLIRQQQLILTGHGFLSSDLVTEYENLQKQVSHVLWPSSFDFKL